MRQTQHIRQALLNDADAAKRQYSLATGELEKFLYPPSPGDPDPEAVKVAAQKHLIALSEYTRVLQEFRDFLHHAKVPPRFLT